MLAGLTKSQRQGGLWCPHQHDIKSAAALAHCLPVLGCDDKSAVGRTAVFALLARWLDEEGPNGDGAQHPVSGEAVSSACLLLVGATTSRACWVNKESVARQMAALAHQCGVQLASGLTAVLARRRDFELTSGLTALHACCCADCLIAVATTAMRPVWSAMPLRPLEPGG